MHDPHEPDPDFVANLEWQLGRELRRSNRIPAGRRAGIQTLKIAGLMLGSVALGAAGMSASQQIGENWRRELLEARLEVQLRLAERRSELQTEVLGITREQVQLGVRNDGDLVFSEFRIARAENEARLLELQLQEVRASGREPLDELSAPLVDGRDFVSERIAVRMELARHELEVVDAERERTQNMVDAGVVSEDELRARQIVAGQAEQELQKLARQQEIRRSYLASAISAVEAELMLLEAESRGRVVQLDRELDYFRRRWEQSQNAESAGAIGPAAVAQVTTRLAEIEAQLRLARAELEIVQRELARRRER